MVRAAGIISLCPLFLRNYRESIIDGNDVRRSGLALRVGLGYFAVWIALGAAIYPSGVALAAAEMASPALSRIAPSAFGVSILVAGTLQFTRWKARLLACCRSVCLLEPSADAVNAWRHGLRLGVYCCCCCAGPTAVLLALGVMDLRAMTVAMAAIAAERLAPAGERIARVTGGIAIGTGIWLIVRAVV